jgi:uncharacterized membrane protein YfcA
MAAYSYYKAGYVDLRAAGLICAGFFIGGYIGAKIAVHMNDISLQRVFGVVTLLISLKMIFAK